MAEFFIEPEDGLTERPELEQREGEDDEIFALAEMAISEIRRYTDRLARGDTSVTRWHEEMTDIIATYHAAAWYIGTDDDPTDEQLDVLAEFVAQELDYLDGFLSDLQAEPDNIPLADKYRNRAELYGYATQVNLWRARFSFWTLPAYPGEKSSCARRCLCSWVVDEVDPEKGDVDATWIMGATEDHCPECEARANGWKPFRIRGFEWEPNQITGGMFN